MNFEIKVIDQFVEEEGSDEEKECWLKIKYFLFEKERLLKLEVKQNELRNNNSD